MKTLHLIADTKFEAEKIELDVEDLRRVGYVVRRGEYRILEGYRFELGDKILLRVFSPTSRLYAEEVLVRGLLQQNAFAVLKSSDLFEVYSYDSLKKDGE